MLVRVYVCVFICLSGHDKYIICPVIFTPFTHYSMFNPHNFVYMFIWYLFVIEVYIIIRPFRRKRVNCKFPTKGGSSPPPCDHPSVLLFLA